ncbi:MAG: YbjQ family protein [Candidatus Baltobacteraceae bacterium]
MIARENLVTLDLPDGYRVLSSLGRVTAGASRPHNMLRATFRSIGAFIGLAPLEYLTDAERAREEALEMLRAKAGALGADAVIKIRFDALEQQDGSTSVLAYGEAVRLAPLTYAQE